MQLPLLLSQREALASSDEPDYEHVDADDEKPAVVKLREGDLTADEAEQIQKDLGESMESQLFLSTKCRADTCVS